MLHHFPTLPSEYLDDGLSKFPLTPEEREPYEGLPNSPRDMVAELTINSEMNKKIYSICY